MGIPPRLPASTVCSRKRRVCAASAPSKIVADILSSRCPFESLPRDATSSVAFFVGTSLLHSFAKSGLLYEPFQERQKCPFIRCCGPKFNNKFELVEHVLKCDQAARDKEWQCLACNMTHTMSPSPVEPVNVVRKRSITTMMRGFRKNSVKSSKGHSKSEPGTPEPSSKKAALPPTNTSNLQSMTPPPVYPGYDVRPDFAQSPCHPQLNVALPDPALAHASDMPAQPLAELSPDVACHEIDSRQVSIGELSAEARPTAANREMWGTLMSFTPPPPVTSPLRIRPLLALQIHAQAAGDARASLPSRKDTVSPLTGTGGHSNIIDSFQPLTDALLTDSPVEEDMVNIAANFASWSAESSMYSQRTGSSQASFSTSVSKTSSDQSRLSSLDSYQTRSSSGRFAHTGINPANMMLPPPVQEPQLEDHDLTNGATKNDRAGFHQCPLCDFKPSGAHPENYPGYLRKHIETHKKTNLKQCPYCSQRSRSDNLRKHIQTSHPHEAATTQLVEDPKEEGLQMPPPPIWPNIGHLGMGSWASISFGPDM